MLRVLFVGDVYGRPGRRVLAAQLPALRDQADFIIVNGENAAGGFGLNRESFELIVSAGADAVTLGNHAWHHREVYGLLDDPRLIRPLNLPPGTPGRGWHTFEVNGERLTVVNLLGRVFMEAVHNPFLAMDELLAQPELGQTRVGQRLRGLSRRGHQRESGAGVVSRRTGRRRDRHPHPRAHRRQPPAARGTAFQTDAGFTGPLHSIIGADPAGPVQKFVTERPHRFGVKDGPAELNGVWLDIEGGWRPADRAPPL